MMHETTVLPDVPENTPAGDDAPDCVPALLREHWFELPDATQAWWRSYGESGTPPLALRVASDLYVLGVISTDTVAHVAPELFEPGAFPGFRWTLGGE